MTVMTLPAPDVTGEAIDSNASVIPGETRPPMFGVGPHVGAIDPELARYGVSVGHSAMGPRDTAIARIDEMISRSDIVKLSDGDLAWLRPGDRHGDAIRWLMSRGPAILVVTHGDTAATGYTRRGSVDVLGDRVEVADPAEWEDAFMAGLLDALTARDLLTLRTDRSLRTIGLDDLRGVLRDAYLCAARPVTPTTV
jgi:sugar/nucleoside kinase (ribokinase family)